MRAARVKAHIGSFKYFFKISRAAGRSAEGGGVDEALRAMGAARAARAEGIWAYIGIL